MPLSAILNMHKYAQNMHKYAQICSDPISISHMHSYAFICTKYAKICKICKHEIYMQHMQKYALPTLLMADDPFSNCKNRMNSVMFFCILRVTSLVKVLPRYSGI